MKERENLALLLLTLSRSLADDAIESTAAMLDSVKQVLGPAKKLARVMLDAIERGEK